MGKHLENYQVAFFPYLNLSKSIELGNYEIWPYYSERNERIKNKDILKQLNKYFKRYFERTLNVKTRTYKDEYIKSICIVTHKAYTIGDNALIDSTFDEIWKIRNILAFSAVTEHTYLTTSTDLFNMVVQRFKVGEEGIFLYSTYISKYNIIKFFKPYTVTSHFENLRITDFATALGSIIDKEEESYNRILETLNIFYYANSHSEMVTIPIKILSMLMCFEVLIEFKNKFDLANKVLNSLPAHKQTIESRILKIKEKGVTSDKEFSKSKTWWWIFDLYNLRSCIVHGKNIEWDSEKNGNLDVILRFCGFLIKRIIWEILYKEGKINEDNIYIGFERRNPDKVLNEFLENQDD